LRHFKLSADGSYGAFPDFAVSRDWRYLAVDGILPDGVIAAFADQHAAVGAQVSIQVEPFHEAAS